MNMPWQTIITTMHCVVGMLNSMNHTLYNTIRHYLDRYLTKLIIMNGDEFVENNQLIM